MKIDFEESRIENWGHLILNNPKRLLQEKEVIENFGIMFNPANLDNLTKEKFKSFLLFKNNKHWEAIHRQSNMITADMDKLIKALKILLDEDEDLKERLNLLFPPNGDDGYIKGLGRAIVTPILMVVYPNKYGVWNTKSEAGLERIGLMPQFKKKETFANKYLQVNMVLKDLAEKYKLSLWQLDEILGWVALGDKPSSLEYGEDGVDIPNNEITEATEDPIDYYENFGLESHLEDFLVENWDRLELSKKYSILEEDGDIVGQQYITDAGIIDILAKSKDGKEWLVIELKKGRTSDQVVGQTLRYMGWIKKNKASEGEKIKGLIIAGKMDEKMKYSLNLISDISTMVYSVNFKLEETKVGNTNNIEN